MLRVTFVLTFKNVLNVFYIICSLFLQINIYIIQHTEYPEKKPHLHTETPNLCAHPVLFLGQMQNNRFNVNFNVKKVIIHTQDFFYWTRKTQPCLQL